MPTSALDMETEHRLLKNLLKREVNSTTFIIAHRISAVKKRRYDYLFRKWRNKGKGNS